MKREEVLKLLYEKEDIDYKNFNEKLTPTRYKMIGVRLPILRKIAKNMAKDYEESLENKEFTYFEEVFLFGLTICYIKADIATRLRYFEEYLNFADNWAHIDSVVMTMKFKKDELNILKEKAKEYALSNKEYVSRAGILFSMKHFLGENDIKESIEILEKADTSKYYVSMAVAWCLCEIMIKNVEFGLKYIKDTKIDGKTVNRAIQKCCDSYRITEGNKEILKAMRIK